MAIKVENLLYGKKFCPMTNSKCVRICFVLNYNRNLIPWNFCKMEYSEQSLLSPTNDLGDGGKDWMYKKEEKRLVFGWT